MTRSIGAIRDRLGSLPAGAVVGALCGAFTGGVLGRLYMRLIFLVDPDRDGARTDFGTAGQFTVGGSVNLAILCTFTGVLGGMLYVAVRRWLPGRSTLGRGLAFGTLLSFGPGAVFLGPVDLTIFEPAVPIFLGFVVLFVLYGGGVALLTDRMSPPSAGLDQSGRSHRVAIMAGLALLVFALLQVGDIIKDAGTCFSGDDNGGCADPAKN